MFIICGIVGCSRDHSTAYYKIEGDGYVVDTVGNPVSYASVGVDAYLKVFLGQQNHLF
jgi:hypothetical protein